MIYKYLVRPRDYHIWELDESNNCYRSFSTKSTTYPDGNRPHANDFYSFENLTENYGFFPIEENELNHYEELHEDYMGFVSWQSRSDGHGGSKGGTYEEYKKSLNRYKK